MNTETTRAIELTKFEAFYICKNTKEEWKHFLWRCDLITMKGRIRIDYKMGLAHVIKAKNRWENDKPKPPVLKAVLHSLILDSQAREMSFIDWCSEFGYDADSLKAFNTYQECCKSASQLSTLYTRAEIEEIKEALQDY